MNGANAAAADGAVRCDISYSILLTLNRGLNVLVFLVLSSRR